MPAPSSKQVQQALYRIAELASAAEDLQAFYRAIHSVVGELMYAENFFIALYDEERQLISFPYYVDELDVDVPDPNQWDPFGEGNARGLTAYVLRTGQPLLVTDPVLQQLLEQGEIELVGIAVEDGSWVGIPLKVEGRTLGVLAVQSYSNDAQYSEQDKELLAFVGQHVGVALSRARAIEETRQRNAELALINSVQEALAGELELQAIYDVVGEKLRDVFDAQVIDIAVYDETTGLIHFPYSIERGIRYPDEPTPLSEHGFRRHVMQTGESLSIGSNVVEASERVGNPVFGSGEMPESVIYVPLIASGKATGVVSLQSFDRQHAFSESDVQLLETLTRSLSVALENARLLHETRQRNAELALINSVQEAIAGELDLQTIYDLVGDKLQAVFDAQVIDIGIHDAATGLLHEPYAIERGVRYRDEPRLLSELGFKRHVMATGEPILVTEDLPAAGERYGVPIIVTGSGEPPKSCVFVPLSAAGKTIGVVSLQNLDREHAFSESDLRLLSTLAGSLSAALDNARLLHETRQRNAELALVNSVQTAIAGELDAQAIYDVVGTKIEEVYDAQVVSISTYDEATGLLSFPYVVERGERFELEPLPLVGFRKHVVETGRPLLINESVTDAAVEYGNPLALAGEVPKSVLFVPLFAGGKPSGVISLQNVDREHAFSESDERLLLTLAGSINAALENARLIEETRQRNAELALINSVQAAIAGELDPKAIYDLVGERLQEVFDAQVVSISVYDDATRLLSFPYVIERGVRLHEEPIPLIGFRKHVIETRESLMLEDVTHEVAERYGNPYVLGGEPSRSAVFVPLVVGGRATGVISLQNVDRTHAFTDADQQLLTTLAGSLSAALDNARLVHETRQRNAELALINSVQEALVGELEMQAIYDVVGDRIREIFDAQGTSISILDETTGLIHFPYLIERGERLRPDPVLLGMGFTRHVLETREPLMLNEGLDAEAERHGSFVVAGETPKSVLFVPLITGGRGNGVIALENFDREHAFTSADQRLLTTLAGSLSAALDNARLVHETRQRNAELALINSVQESIAGELDQQAIYDLVGEKLREVFDAQVVDIAVRDEDAEILRFVYQIERGVQFPNVTLPVIGFRKHVMETREPLYIDEDIDAALVEFGNPVVVTGEPSRGCAMFQPLVVGGRATGVISIQNLDHEHMFTDSDRRLLATIAGSLGVALENAQLIHETRQRVAELATVNSVGQALASQLELDALIELVGERVRETFQADIAYVALHDESADQIDFAYYYESGERRDEPSFPYGEGLTSVIIDSREPLLMNREEQYEGRESIGTQSRSYLGVPILVGEKAIGVISVQSIAEEGRFGEGDTRLLATIAANVGVAMQTARLFAEVGRQKQFFESLVEVSPVAVVVMDADERVTGWNPAAAELFGHVQDDAVGQKIDELVFNSARREEGREITLEALESGLAQRIAQRDRKDGTRVDVELMLVPLHFNGEHVGFYAIYHDISELERARQEAEAATQAKSAFLATMSHEIRTPMNAVIGMTDLLLGTDLTGEQREFAEVVRSSGDALLYVIDDILDYSKIEAGKLELEREPLDLRECVEGALEIVAPRAWEKEIELGCLIDEGVPAGIVGDAARLRQVLLNLLSNAVKFTEKGEVVVLVAAERAPSGSYQLELVVRDTGIGIPRDRMDRLFTSFSQVDASTTRRYGGTGLGLAISKRLVDLMGGTIRVESEPGKGSTFHIALLAEQAAVPPQIPAADELLQLRGKRILIVDDNATNREIVTRHARAWGMEPVAVEAGADALELIDHGEPFDVAVLDMMMPGMDGAALARELRRRRSAHELPLLLLTSLGRLPQAAALDVFDAQLAKPVRASQLYNALVRLVTAGVDTGELADAAHDRKPESSSLRILLAEDNAVNQKVALRLLERLGFGADVVWNGLEALEALEQRPYDVVLMDMQMPELDGLDATRRICARWPAETRPRIIAMTANALPEDREACFAAGMDDYVAKPIKPHELAAALKQAKPIERNQGGAASTGADGRLDNAALDNLRELGGDEFVAEVIDTFLADAPELLATLRRSLDAHDAEELRRAAHTLKSNAATLGAGAFSELCRELELRAKEDRLDEAAELVTRVEREQPSLSDTLISLRLQTAP